MKYTASHIALLLTMMHWREGRVAGARGDEMAAKASGWVDAIDGRNGGAERIVLDILLQVERFDYRAGEQDPGAMTPVDALQFSQEGFACVLRVL